VASEHSALAAAPAAASSSAFRFILVLLVLSPRVLTYGALSHEA
jgi:hypothetical protein